MKMFFSLFLCPIRFMKLASKLKFKHKKCLILGHQYFVSVMDTACISDGQMHICKSVRHWRNFCPFLMPFFLSDPYRSDPGEAFLLSGWLGPPANTVKSFTSDAAQTHVTIQQKCSKVFKSALKFPQKYPQKYPKNVPKVSQKYPDSVPKVLQKCPKIKS